MIRLRFLLVMICICSMPMQAGAQDSGPIAQSRAKALEQRLQAEGGRLAMADYADCILLNNPKEVKTFLASRSDGPTTTPLAAKAASSLCTRFQKMRFKNAVFRGALYGSLYRKKFGHKPVAFTDKPIDFWADISGMEQAEASEYVAIRQFAECVVRADPATSREIVVGAIGSVADKAAYQRLNPLLGPCLSQGIKAELNKQSLSGYIAEILYRLSSEGSPP